jgi:hypothetical protein
MVICVPTAAGVATDVVPVVDVQASGLKALNGPTVNAHVCGTLLTVMDTT